MAQWTLFDPLGNGGAGETYTFPVNPSEGGTPAKRRPFTEESNVAGGVILFEGARPPMHIEFSGRIRDQATFEALYDVWFEKEHQVRLTDDLGRIFWIMFAEIDPKRMRAARVPWKHSYSMQAVVLSVGA